MASPSANQPPEPEGSLEHPDLDTLDAQITELASHIHAATYRWLRLVREFDEHPGWGGWGLKSTAHYLNWRCGIGLTAAREHVRVTRALDTLPTISAAFAKGDVSYSKVRAMTRVATPENEDYFLGLAIHGTASHIEQVAREYRQVRIEAGLEERKPTPVRRAVRYYWDEDGMLVFSGRLPAEQGALVVKALEAGIQTLEDGRAEAVEREVNEEADREQATHDSAEAYSVQVNQDTEDLSDNNEPGGPAAVNEREARADDSAEASSPEAHEDTHTLGAREPPHHADASAEAPPPLPWSPPPPEPYDYNQADDSLGAMSSRSTREPPR